LQASDDNFRTFRTDSFCNSTTAAPQLVVALSKDFLRSPECRSYLQDLQFGQNFSSNRELASSSSWLPFLQPLSLPLVSPSIHCWAVNTRYIHDLQLLQERLQLFKLCTLLSTLSATNLSLHIQPALDILSYTTKYSPVDGLLLPFSTTATDTDYLGNSRFPLFDPDTNCGRLCHRRSTAQLVRGKTLANRFTEE